jgi:hypothetical protein
MAGVVAVPSTTSPTGGTVNVASGINTSENALLPGGFTQSQLGVGTQNAATANPSSYVTAGESQMQGPTNWNVTANQTVAGQYAADMATTSPAQQAAEQAVVRQSAAAGGGNDLMTSTAAAMAGSQVALTMASQDAQTYAAAGQYNATAANTYSQNLNAFVENAQLSNQNFNQGVSMLNAQTNQQLQLITANVNANTANTTTSLNASLDQTQASLTSTLAQMNQNFAETEQNNLQQYGINSQEAVNNYGMQVQLGYLSSVNSQMTSLTNEIANISSNPNITATQAEGAMSDAVNEFNTFMTQLSSYSSSMMPSSTTATENGTYSNPDYNYSYVNASTWPAASTSGTSSSSPLA